jgi:hypothetical protein
MGQRRCCWTPSRIDLLGTPHYEHLLAARTLLGQQLLEAARTWCDRRRRM